jgi:hypothetical protein
VTFLRFYDLLQGRREGESDLLAFAVFFQDILFWVNISPVLSVVCIS